MSSSIESRIVTMKFDNKQFAQGVSDTMSILKKLQFAITGIPKSVPGFGRGSTDTSGLDDMSAKVGGISTKFLALGTVAVTALSNITNRAVNAGLAMGKSLTVQPILDGFAEYELKMGSIQTILSNTSRHGTTLKEVTKNLDELNEYADKTIYNFGDMTKNIGLFTNAGIKIEDATAMIKGFSNEAAASGTNAQGAASAAYQLSQALSAGTIRLMDWRSLQNVGMGNKNMQNGLIEIADAMGMLEEKGVSAMQIADDFNGSLEKKWLTADVMQNYLKIQAGELSKEQMRTIGLTDKQITAFMKQQKIAEDAATKVRTWTQLVGTIREGIGSSWAETFDIVIGDFNTATKLFTNISDVVGAFFERLGNARNKMLKGWVKWGGRDALIEGLANAFKALFAILKPVAQAFRDIFPRKTGKELAEATKAFRDFTESLIIGGDTANNIRRTFRGFFAVLGIGWEILKGLARYFFTFLGLFDGAAGGVTELTGGVGDFLVKLHEWLVEGERISGFFDMIISAREKALGPIIDLIGNIIGALGKLVGFLLGRLADGIEVLQPVGDFLGNAALKASEFITTRLDVFLDRVVSYFKTWSPYVDAVGAALERAYNAVANFISGLDVGGFASDLASMAASGAAEFVSLLADGFERLGPIVKDIGGTVRGAFGALVGAAGGISLGGIFDIRDETSAASQGINQVGAAMKKTTGIGEVFKSMWSGLVDFFRAIGEFFAPLWNAVSSFFGKIKEKVGDFVRGMGIEDALAIVNTGFFIMLYKAASGFMKKWGKIGESIGGAFESMGGTFDQLTGNLKTMQRDVRANIILKIAGAVAILAAALWILSKIPAKKLGFALGAVAASLTFMMIALKSMNKMVEAGKKGAIASALQMTAMSVALLALGLALLAFAGAIAILGNMDTKTLVKGIGSVAAILAVIVGATAILSKTGGAGQILFASVAIGILAVALLAFAAVIKIYEQMDLASLANGGLKIAAALLVLGLAMQAFPKGMLLKSVGLVLLTGALLILAGALKIFASMSVGEMIKAIVMLAASLGILVVAMQGFQSSILGAAALVLVATALGILLPILITMGQLAWGTIFKGLIMLAGALLIFVGAGALAMAVAPGLLALGAALLMFGAAVLLAGAGVAMLGAGFAVLAASGSAGIAVLTAAVISFANLLPLIMHQFGMGLLALAKVLHKTGPPLVKALGAILRQMIREVIKSTPLFGKMLIVMIRTGLRVIRALIPDFVKTGLKLIIGFLAGVASRIDKITGLAVRIVVGFITGIAKRIRSIINAGVTLIVSFIRGVADAIDRRGDEVGRAGLRLARAIISGMLRGLSEGAKWVKDKLVDIAKDALKGALSFLGVNSPSKKFIEVGRSIDEGWALGISRHSRMVTSAGEDVAAGALKKIRASMARMSDMVDGNVDMNPVIRPVLDLTQVQNEASRLGGMLGAGSIPAGMSYAQAAAIANQRAAEGSTTEESTPVQQEIKFEQNNYSPKALSHVEIHRATRSQITLAEEALKRGIR